MPLSVVLEGRRHLRPVGPGLHWQQHGSSRWFKLFRLHVATKDLWDVTCRSEVSSTEGVAAERLIQWQWPTIQLRIAK